MCGFAQLIKGSTKGVTFKVGVVVVKGQAVQYSGIGLAEFLFRNISLLTEVCKDSQFKVKIVVFTAVLGFVGIELSQVSQLFAIGLCLSGLRICNLDNGKKVLVCILVYRGIAVHILGYGGIVVCSMVRNLSIRCALASKINSNAIQVYKMNLVE